MTKTDKIYAFGLIFFLMFSMIGMGIYAEHLEGQVTQYKEQAQDKHTKVVETQLKYEAVKHELDETQAKYEAAKEALSEYKARQARASRSRQVQPSSDVQRKRTSGLGRSTESIREDVFAGGTRDITMYCPTGNRTASGKWPRPGMVATISRSIPFGTRVLIEGLGEFVVEDRIGSGSQFDIYSPSCDEARRFGRQHRRVTIL